MNPLKVFSKLNINLNNKQQEIVESIMKNDVTVIKGTRRGGKSMVSAGVTTAFMLDPENTSAILAPTLHLTTITFEQTLKNLTTTLNLKPSSLNNKDKIVKFPWGSALYSTSLRNKKQILGNSYNTFLFDEAAVADEPNLDFIFLEILPTLLQKKGKLIAISTPRGTNYFYDLYKYAEITPNWNAVSYTIYEQSHIPIEEVEQMKALYYSKGMERFFAQEFLVEWVSLTGAVFDFTPQSKILKDVEGDKFIAIDPGSNYFAGVLACINDDGLFILDCFKYTKQSTATIAERLRKWEDSHDITEYYIDTAAQQTKIDLVEYDFSFRNATKDITAGLNSVRLFKDRIYLNSEAEGAEDFLDEWNNYVYDKDSGKPRKTNDHLLDALRYLVHSAINDRLVEVECLKL